MKTIPIETDVIKSILFTLVIQTSYSGLYVGLDIYKI